MLGRLATSATVIALVGYGCAQGEGLPPGAGSGGVGGDLDASLGGGPTGGMGGSSGAVTGGAAGSGGGPAGAGGLSTDASVGGAGASGGVGGSGGSGGGTGGSGGGTGGSGGGTGGSGGGTGGTGGGSGGFGGCPIVSWSFDTCPSGWTPAGNGNDWACGKPTNGPGGDHTTGSGNAWATNLSSNSANCADSTLTSPVVDLSAHTGQQVRIQYWHWHDFRACNPGGLGGLCGAVCTLENSTYSGGIVEAFNGSSWQKVTPTTGYPGKNIECYYVSADGGTTCSPCALDGQKGFDGASGVWVPIELDVSTFTHAQFQLRFHFASSASDPFCYPPKAGWYIDDVRVAKLSCP